MKFFLRNKFAALILVLLIAFLPTTISLPQQSRSENIVTAVGVDKNGDEFEVSIQYVIPYAESSQNSLKLISEKAKSVGEAVQKLNQEYGRISGFAHCKALIVGNEACESNLANAVDYFLRIKTNTNDIVLLNTNKSAKDVLGCVNNLDNEFYSIINSNSISSDGRHFQDLKSIGDFYQQMFANNKCIALPFVSVEEDGKGETSSGGAGGNIEEGGAGGSSGQNGGSSNSGGKKKIKNDGKLSIIKNCKKILELSAEDSHNLLWFNSKVRESSLEIENFSDEFYDNANLRFNVYDKKVKVDVSFDKDTPVYTLGLKVHIRLAQLVSNNLKVDNFQVKNQKFSSKLVEKIKSEINQNLVSAEQIFKENEFDVVDCFELFHKFKTKQFNEFLSKQTEYYIKGVKFNYNIEVVQHL